MAVDFVYKLVYPDGTTFNFASPYELSAIDSDTLSLRIPIGETPGAEGEYQDPAVPGTRVLTVAGELLASTAQQLRDYWDTLATNLDYGTPGKFYRNSDRYINVRLESLSEEVFDSPGVFYKKWRAGFRCTPPFYYADATNFSLLTVGGTATVNAGGSTFAYPTVQLNFTSPGTATVYSLDRGKSFFVNAPTAGVFSVDSDAIMRGRLGATIGNSDQSANFYGQAIDLPYRSSGRLAVTLSGGASVSWGSVSWQQRYKTA